MTQNFAALQNHRRFYVQDFLVDNLKINNAKTKLLKCFLRNQKSLPISSTIVDAYLGEAAVDVK